MGTTADKLERLAETKNVLKEILVEQKGITEAASEDNFYSLVELVGRVPKLESITGDGSNTITVSFRVKGFLIHLQEPPISVNTVLSGVYDSDINVCFFSRALGVSPESFLVFDLAGSTEISTNTGKFAKGKNYILYYW